MKHLGAMLGGFITIWLITFTITAGVCAALKVFGVL